MTIKRYIYIMFDLISVVFASAFAMLLRFDFQVPTSHYSMLLVFTCVAIVATPIIGLLIGNYSSDLKYFGFYEIIKQFSVTSIVAVILIILKITNTVNISGSISAIYCIIYFMITSAFRGVPRLLRFVRIQLKMENKDSVRVLIVGAGQAGAMVAKQFISNYDEHIVPVGILDDDAKKIGTKISGIKVFGKISDAESIARKVRAEQILVAIPSCSTDEFNAIYSKINLTGLPTKIFRTAIDVKNYKDGDFNSINDVTIEDLLFRESIDTNKNENLKFIQGKNVMVTGGAGSIGSELCFQILENDCKHLIIFDIHENGLFELNEEFKQKYQGRYTTCVGSVRDKKRLEVVFDKYNPELVFHAAAHKHVPMMEINPFEAVKNNVLGTRNVILTAIAHKCQKFVLISTDKAVNPTNVMGATKRACELLIKAYSNHQTEMVAVRFGNVLGSNGSVIPLFKKQIAAGGPVTVTHQDMTRYFMTIKEAVSLVLSAGASANGSELFVLDMGKPVKIYDLAENLIKLSGFTPGKDIKIKIMGLRDGEKLFEELNLNNEIVDKTSHDKIFIIKDNGFDYVRILEDINNIEQMIVNQDNEKLIKDALFELICEDDLIVTS